MNPHSGLRTAFLAAALLTTRVAAIGEEYRLPSAELLAWPHSQRDDASKHYNLGNELSKKGDLEGAIAEYRLGISLRPNSPQLHNNLGTALYHKGDLDGAIAEYRVAISKQPKYPLAHAGLASALHDRGDLEGAIAEYRVAIRQQPKYPLAHAGLASVLHDEDDFDGAIAEYRVAISQQPDYAWAQAGLASVLHDKGEYGSHSVKLSWHASSSRVSGYNVFRSTVPDGPYRQLNSSPVTATQFADSAVRSGRTYYYVVTAVDATGTQSKNSNQAMAVIP